MTKSVNEYGIFNITGIHWGEDISLEKGSSGVTRWLVVKIEGMHCSRHEFTIHAGHSDEFWGKLCDLYEAWKDSQVKPLPSPGEDEAAAEGAFGEGAEAILQERKEIR